MLADSMKLVRKKLSVALGCDMAPFKGLVKSIVYEFERVWTVKPAAAVQGTADDDDDDVVFVKEITAADRVVAARASAIDLDDFDDFGPE